MGHIETNRSEGSQFIDPENFPWARQFVESSHFQVFVTFGWLYVRILFQLDDLKWYEQEFLPPILPHCCVKRFGFSPICSLHMLLETF